MDPITDPKIEKTPAVSNQKRRNSISDVQFSQIENKNHEKIFEILLNDYKSVRENLVDLCCKFGNLEESFEYTLKEIKSNDSPPAALRFLAFQVRVLSRLLNESTETINNCRNKNHQIFDCLSEKEKAKYDQLHLKKFAGLIQQQKNFIQLLELEIDEYMDLSKSDDELRNSFQAKIIDDLPTHLEKIKDSFQQVNSKLTFIERQEEESTSEEESISDRKTSSSEKTDKNIVKQSLRKIFDKIGINELKNKKEGSSDKELKNIQESIPPFKDGLDDLWRSNRVVTFCQTPKELIIVCRDFLPKMIKLEKDSKNLSNKIIDSKEYIMQKYNESTYQILYQSFFGNATNDDIGEKYFLKGLESRIQKLADISNGKGCILDESSKEGKEVSLKEEINWNLKMFPEDQKSFANYIRMTFLSEMPLKGGEFRTIKSGLEKANFISKTLKGLGFDWDG